MTKDLCINCGKKLSEGDKQNNYPESFSVYKCPECGYENEWWILRGFDKEPTLESILRALFLDSFLQGKEIMYDQVFQHIKEKYNIENCSAKQIRDALNRLFNRVLVKNKIKADRYPHDKLPDEKYHKIFISNNNTLDDFFNKRIIRQWDLKYITFDLKELKEKIQNLTKICYLNRWLVTFDYFLTTPES